MNVSWTTSSASAAEPVMRYDNPQRYERWSANQPVKTASVAAIALRLERQNLRGAACCVETARDAGIRELTGRPNPVPREKHVRDARQATVVPSGKATRGGGNEGVTDH